MNLTVTSLLKRVLPLKGFCYRQARWSQTETKAIEIAIEARKGSRPRCGCCRRKASVYDTRQEPRCWQFIMLWGILVFFVYAARRVNCKRCGVRMEHLPWASGKFRLCDALRIFLAQWARLLSWQDVAVRFRVSWADVYGSVKWVVKYGLRHRDLTGISAVGVDEVCVGRGKFWTLAYQIDEGSKRLLWVGKDRTAKTLDVFFNRMGPQVCAGIAFICSDMWRAYLAVIARRLPDALHILDRFHIRRNLSDAVDQIRRAESTAMAQAGISPLLKKMRWALLKPVFDSLKS